MTQAKQGGSSDSSTVRTTDEPSVDGDAQREQTRQILAASPDGVVVLHDAQVLFANEAACELVGLSADAMRQRAFTHHLCEESLPFEPPGEGLCELRMRDARGETHVVECHARPIDYAGRSAIVLCLRDITARRQSEEQLARTERLAAVGSLIAGVSHEFNNPLTFILGNLEVLARTLTAPDQARMARDALGGAERLSKLINNLRTFRYGDEALTTVDVNAVIADVLGMAEPKLRGKARIRRTLGSLPQIEARAASLGQVILNLVLTVADALPDRPAHLNEIVVRSAIQADQLCVAVEGNATVMAPAVRHRIFDPFFSTQDAGGAGLGLAVSNSMIQQMGGLIDQVTPPGGGTRFVIQLPLGTAQHDVASPATAPPVSPSGNWHILVVDDELSIGRILGRVLEDFGEVHLAGSGRAAIRRLAAGERFDVILSDVVMHHGSGMELANWLDAHLPEMADRLILMSGLVQEHNRWPILRKPLDFDALRTLIQRTGQRNEDAPARPSLVQA